MRPVTRGRIAAIDGSFGVGDLEDVCGQNSLNGRPTSAVNVLERGTLPCGQRYAAGLMAYRKEERVEVPRIDTEGVIDVSHEEQVTEAWSAFALVPGEFAVGWTDWSFDFLVHNFPVWEANEQAINLTAFYEDNSFAEVGSVGFLGRQDEAEKGTVHGMNVPEDTAIGTDLNHGSILNELRFRYSIGDLPIPEAYLKAYIAASGYVELYTPEDATTEDFLEYLRAEVIPYTEDEEDDDG